jgi:hypothetical protein
MKVDRRHPGREHLFAASSVLAEGRSPSAPMDY